MEAVAAIDLLSRAGVEVCLANIGGDSLVAGRSGIRLQTTSQITKIKNGDLYDAVILPGGPGIKQLRGHEMLCELLRQHHNENRILACICAAPLLLLDAGILPVKYTAHPSTLAELPEAQPAACVWDGRILTSQGAGTATQFGLALVQALTNETQASEIAESICWS